MAAGDTALTSIKLNIHDIISPLKRFAFDGCANLCHMDVFDNSTFIACYCLFAFLKWERLL